MKSTVLKAIICIAVLSLIMDAAGAEPTAAPLLGAKAYNPEADFDHDGDVDFDDFSYFGSVYGTHC